MDTKIKRPLALTVLCIIGFINNGLLVFGVFAVPGLQLLGIGVLSLVFSLGVLGLAAFFGLWKMRKWGLYVYIVTVIATFGLNATLGAAGYIAGDFLAYILPLVIIGTSLYYFKQLR